jgi:hypothetical protein
MLRTSIALIIVFLLMGSVSKKDYMVINGKQITVNGNTSVGRFSCSYLITDQCDTLLLNSSDLTKSLLDVKMPVAAFGCGNFLINKDFQRSLKAKEFPMAEVSVLRMTRTHHNSYKGDILLKVAGKVIHLKDIGFKEFTVNRSVALRTVMKLNTTELNLQTASRLNGLVTVDEELEIVVELMR